MRRRLSALLRVRGLVEDQRRAELARAQRMLAEAEQLRHAAEAARATTPVSTGFTPREAAMTRLYGLALHEAVEIAQAEELRLGRAAQEAARHRVDAGIDRRVVERLDERDRAERALRAARKAEQTLDEAAGEQWSRRHG